MREMTPMQQRLTEESRWDFCDLKAVYINCTLKRSPEASHTQGLADRSIAILESNGVGVEVVRAIDHDIATGVWPDMTEHGWERDDWPAIFEKVIAAQGSTRTTAGGIPAHGNQRTEWDAGCRFDYPNPEHR
jgi:hypothetical protein